MLQDLLKYKLIFIETPDAAETSLALENYRAVSASDNFYQGEGLANVLLWVRHVTTAAVRCYSPLLEERCPKEWILIITMVEL